MASSDQTSIRRRWMAAIATAVFTALALATSEPARVQETGEGTSAASPAEMMAPAGMMQMMMGATSRVRCACR
jgi:hypothetical protein